MALNLNKSIQAFEEAKQYIPGGVNSPVRSFRGVGGTPPFIARAAGSYLYDIDGNKYIDYIVRDNTNYHLITCILLNKHFYLCYK